MTPHGIIVKMRTKPIKGIYVTEKGFNSIQEDLILISIGDKFYKKWYCHLMLNDDGSIILLILVVELSSPTFDAKAKTKYVAFLAPLYSIKLCTPVRTLWSGTINGLHPCDRIISVHLWTTQISLNFTWSVYQLKTTLAVNKCYLSLIRVFL